MLASRLTSPASTASRDQKERPHFHHQRRRPRTASMGEVCKYWMEGRCTRRSCTYVHPPIYKDQRQAQQQKNKAHSHTYLNRAVPSKNKTWHRQADELVLASTPPQNNTLRKAPLQDSTVQDVQSACVDATPSPPSTKLDSALPPNAANRVLNECKTEEEKQGLGSLIANLSGHDTPITSMVLPISSTSKNMLFSAGEDAMLCAWDCSSGLCTDTLHLAHPPSCLFNSFLDPHWLFIGLPDEVRVCNVSTHTQQTLKVNSPVLSLSSSGNLLAAGLQDGAIWVWRFEPSSASFHPFRCLSPSISTHASINHMTSSPVSSLEPCLALGSSIIYAGSLDGIIRVWDLASGSCLQVLCAHNKAITRLLSCDPTLVVSASQDGAIKLWKLSAPGHDHLSLQDTFLPELACSGHGLEDGGALSCPQPLAMCGVFDEANKPILFAAYTDNKVRIMEVPSFKCKGTIRTESPIQAMDTGSGNMLFLGSSKGNISVWKWK